MPQLKHRAVAGTFLFKFPHGDLSQPPKVALFRRSDKVRTYQHKYAPISGSVEDSDANPLATAWRELKEETTLTCPTIRLFRQGKPYSFDDESIGRSWSINPFGFILSSEASESAIRLDWEHEDYDWFDPRDLENEAEFPGVPRLLESFRRVWFDIDLGQDAGTGLAIGLRVLQDDHESGARQLASRALDIYIDVLSRLDTTSAEKWWKNARFAGWHLWKNGRESMGAPILSVVLSSLAIIEKKLPKDISNNPLPDGFMVNAIKDIKEFAQQRQDSSSKIADSFSRFLAETFPSSKPISILTLSASSTITASLTHLIQSVNCPALDIRVLESRPLFEGVKTARAVADAVSKKGAKNSNVRVTVFTDASAAVAAQDVDLVLIGADLIDRSGRVSNKTGSLPAVLAAKHVSPNAKIVALSEKEKVLPFEPPGHEDNDAQEITGSWNGDLTSFSSSSDVAVRNVYFEWVNAELVDKYIAEDGIWTSDGIAEWAAEVEKQADTFFSSL
ncbi:Methylthioribose-1-phosphate isomerase [Paramyrothecium foliicola]|nr:Methylthioribose-1-phosphate isomerase [Paramyrothecium foliicola]